MHLLFLDDSKERWKEFGGYVRALPDLRVCKWAKTPDAVEGYLAAAAWDVVFLDHDLLPHNPPPSDPMTGSEAVRRMVTWPWPHARPTLTVVHSHSEPGVLYMTTLLNQNGFPYVRAKFGTEAFPAVCRDLRRLVALRS